MNPSIPKTANSPAGDDHPWQRPVPDPEAVESVTMSIVQRIDDPDPVRAAAQAREDLENGANGLALVFAGAPNAFGYGLPASIEGLKAALHDVPLQDIHLRIEAHPQSRASIDWLAAILQEKQVDPSRMQLSFGVDPTATFAGTGRLRMTIEVLEASLPQSLGGFFALSLPGILLEADGRVYHNAGASAAQELGIMLASVVAHFKMFEEARQPLIYAIPHVGFSISLDQNILASTAKVRALRKLWTRILAEYGIEPTAAIIHAETSYRMLSTQDGEANIVRNTMAAIAASFSGIDSLSTLPNTLSHGLPDPNARRIARTTPLLLEVESETYRLALAQSDEADALVERYCEDAWAEYQQIMSEGGALRSLAAGAIQQRIASSRQERQQQIAAGELKLVGTTIYPVSTIPILPSINDSNPELSQDAAIQCEPLLPLRLEEYSTSIPEANI